MAGEGVEWGSSRSPRSIHTALLFSFCLCDSWRSGRASRSGPPLPQILGQLRNGEGAELSAGCIPLFAFDSSSVTGFFRFVQYL